jgi:hypothetical protein
MPAAATTHPLPEVVDGCQLGHGVAAEQVCKLGEHGSEDLVLELAGLLGGLRR